jgi:hypothetical protein
VTLDCFAALAQKSNRRCFQRFQQQPERFLGNAMKLTALRRIRDDPRREHQMINPVAAEPEIHRGVDKARQFRAFRRFCDGRSKRRHELTEGLGGDGRQQRLAVRKMLVGGRLRDAEFLRQRADVDGFQAASLGFLQRGLNQRLPEIAVMVGVERLADQARRHLLQ